MPNNGCRPPAGPGGRVRRPGLTGSTGRTVQRGAGSKDTWIQAAGPVSTFSLLRPANAPLELSRGGGDLPSRVADNLFWLGRYVERAECTVRLMRGIAHRLTEINYVDMRYSNGFAIGWRGAQTPAAGPTDG